MSYLQTDFKGVPTGWKVNNLAVELFARHISADAMESTSVYAMVYAGLRANHYQKYPGEEPDFSFSDVVDWVDAKMEAGDKEIFLQMDKVFGESQSYKTWIANFQEQLKAILQPEEEGKKKAGKKKPSAGSKSTSSHSES